MTAKLRQISRIWIWWVAGGCALLLVIGMGGAIWGVVSLIKTVNSIGPVPSNCLPSDFPGYPGAIVGDVSEFTGAGAPRGYSEECQMTFESNDDSATVRDFYASRLGICHYTDQSLQANGSRAFSGSRSVAANCRW